MERDELEAILERMEAMRDMIQATNNAIENIAGPKAGDVRKTAYPVLDACLIRQAGGSAGEPRHLGQRQHDLE